MPGEKVIDQPDVTPAGAPLPKPDEGQGDKADNKADDTAANELKATMDTLEAIQKEHGNLQELYGRQSNELGDLRGQTQEMAAALGAVQNQLKESRTASLPDDDAKIVEIYDQMETGDLTAAEGMRRVLAIKDAQQERVTQTAVQETLSMANAEFQKELSTRDGRARENAFLEANPDFVELQKSGALAGIKQKNSLHDDFSAYYELKSMQAFEKGKLEQAKVEEGVDAAGKVLTKPGSAIRQVNKPQKSLTPAETEQRGLSVLQQVREVEGRA